MGDRYRNRSGRKQSFWRSRTVGLSLIIASITASALLAGCSQPGDFGARDMEPATANSEDADSSESSGAVTSQANSAKEFFSQRKATSSTSSGSEDARSGNKKQKGLPLWERPEVLAKYPVKAKKNPDGSYDYSDPRFENADLCEDAPPGYWEGLGYRVVGPDYIKLRTLKNCIIQIGDGNWSDGFGVTTDKLEKKQIIDRRSKWYSPSRYDQPKEVDGLKGCVSYIETPVGRVGFGYVDFDELMDFTRLCDISRKSLERIL